MKTVSILALAATVSATGWNDASSFSCPGNTDNSCNSEQTGDDFSSWGDLEVGADVSYFGGLYFGNTKCESAGSFGKRALVSRFEPRTFGKALGGSCGQDSSSSVNFGCGSSSGSGSGSSGYGYGSNSGSSSSGDISAFSIDYFSIYTEFDCDLEFQYTMGDGSSCKHRSSCSSQGSTVKNSQCGGATNLTIVYPTGQTGDHIPPQSTTCSVNIPTVSFSCGTASSTVVPTTTASVSTVVPTTTASGSASTETHVTPSGGGSSGPPPATGGYTPTGFTSVSSTATTSSTAVVETPGQPSNVQSSTTAPVVETPGHPSSVQSSTTTAVVETPGQPSHVQSSTTAPVVETPGQPSDVHSSTASSTVVVETPGSTVVGSTVVESSTTSNSPVTQTTPPGESQTTPPSGESSDYSTSTYVTSYIGTSTVYSTSVSTITSCAPEITDCPANGHTAVTTVVVAVSTTICPITETQTVIYSSGAITPIGSGAVPTPTPEEPASSNSPVQPSGSGDAGTSAATTVTSVPASTATETINYPTVLPACIATWNYITGCVDNSDTSCYCPDATFVQNVYDCLYAYGENDQDVADAVSYFQGICASHAQDNPAIVTGASCTSYITATPIPIPNVNVTTVVVTATTVVPCTGTDGSVIPSSSTTLTTSISMTVPQVGLTTETSSGTTSVGVVPVASYTQVTASSNGAHGQGTPYATPTVHGSQPSGVAGASGAGATATTSATGTFVTAGASKAHGGAGFGAAVLAAFALVL